MKLISAIIIMIYLNINSNIFSKDTTDTYKTLERVNFSISLQYLIPPSQEQIYSRRLGIGVGLGCEFNYRILKPLSAGITMSFTAGNQNIIAPLELSLSLHAPSYKKISPFLTFGMGRTYHYFSTGGSDPVPHYSFTNSYSIGAGTQINKITVKGRYLHIDGNWEFPTYKLLLLSFGLTF